MLVSGTICSSGLIHMMMSAVHGDEGSVKWLLLRGINIESHTSLPVCFLGNLTQRSSIKAFLSRNRLN